MLLQCGERKKMTSHKSFSSEELSQKSSANLSWCSFEVDYTRLTFIFRNVSFKQYLGTSLVVQWIRLCVPNAGGSGLIPAQGTRLPHAATKSSHATKDLM